MSYATIRTALATAIGAVAGITGGAGKVIKYEPHISREEDYRTAFTNAGNTIVNAWTITRDSRRETQKDAGFRFVRSHSIVVTGRYGLGNDGATEETFQDLTDTVADALRALLTVWPDQPEGGNAVQVENIGYERHGRFLVHMAKMRLTIDEVAVISA